jgi:RNA polymerase subunit RPABC4/transcription elongation factor Spt4
MELHCQNCHELLDRVATTCPACRLDLTAHREVPEVIEVDLDKERADLLAAVVALGDTRTPHRPPPWRASVPLPIRPDPSGFAGLEADIVPRPRHRH